MLQSIHTLQLAHTDTDHAASYNPRVQCRSQSRRAFREVLRRRVSFAGMHAIGKLRPVTAATRGCLPARPARRAEASFPRHRRSPAVRRRPSVPGRNPCRHRPPARRCVKYVGCPLERTTPGGAKRARGKEFNSGRYYGDGGGDVVVSAVVLMTSGAPTAPVQYRRLTDVCPLPSPQQPAPYSASATL